MIKMKIDTSDITKLIKDLKLAEEEIALAGMKAVVSLQDRANNSFITNIGKLVYNLYEPQQYVRTDHLRGHGSIIENIEFNSFLCQYVFEIDEQSRDKNGERWMDKADRVEEGKLNGAGFERPFIEETQSGLEKELDKVSRDYMSDVGKVLARRF